MFKLLKDDGKEIILQATETSLYADRIGKMFRFKRVLSANLLKPGEKKG